MTTHRIKGNREEQWTIDTSNDTWIVEKGAKITTVDEYGIAESGQDHSDIRVNGRIEVSGSVSGINFAGDNSRVHVGRNGSIDASDGQHAIHTNAAGGTIVNAGRLEGQINGIYGSGWGVVENTGTITGGQGISFHLAGFEVDNEGLIRGIDGAAVTGRLDGSLIVNGGDGVMRSGLAATIVTTGSGSGTIENHGLVRGAGTAIADTDGSVDILNTGRIVGDILMGEGHDTIDTAKGVVKGEIRGGDGNDTYIVGKAPVTIVENAAEGYDYVRSKASFTMGDNLESLQLLGRKNIDGTGNDGFNSLEGNTGANVLKGLGGTDMLAGGKGRDTLFGGEGVDTFVFAAGGGRDRIMDFEDGIDELSIVGVNDQADFLELAITDVRGGALIEYDGGRIFLKDMQATDIAWADFA